MKPLKETIRNHPLALAHKRVYLQTKLHGYDRIREETWDTTINSAVRYFCDVFSINNNFLFGRLF